MPVSPEQGRRAMVLFRQSRPACATYLAGVAREADVDMDLVRQRRAEILGPEQAGLGPAGA